MANSPDMPAGRDIRELARGLAAAPDAKVAQIVGVVDLLPQRGGADALIAPLRPRLAQLRPRRPLRFVRLLFLPLDPLIVPAPQWDPAAPTIPRSVLPALAATVRDGLGTEIGLIDAMIRAASAEQAEIVKRAGALVWPRAAEHLLAAPPPVGWADTGLSVGLYPGLARRVGAVLAQAPQIQGLLDEAAIGIAAPRAGPVRAMLADAGNRCLDALPMLVMLLLARLPQLAPLIAAAAPDQAPQAEEALRQASDAAAAALLCSLESATGSEAAMAGAGLADAVQEVRRMAALLQQFKERPGAPLFRTRVQAVRQRLDGECRQRFARAVAAEFLPAVQQAAAGGAADTGPLEQTARHLRELEMEARAFGGGDAYDTQLRSAAAAVRNSTAGMSDAARVRLVEILAGPEAAMALLESLSRGGGM